MPFCESYLKSGARAMWCQNARLKLSSQLAKIIFDKKKIVQVTPENLYQFRGSWKRWRSAGEEILVRFWFAFPSQNWIALSSPPRDAFQPRLVLFRSIYYPISAEGTLCPSASPNVFTHSFYAYFRRAQPTRPSRAQASLELQRFFRTQTRVRGK